MNGVGSTNGTLLNSVDGYIKQIKGGLAFSYYHNDFSQGVLKTDMFSLTYAQHFSLLEGQLKIIPSVQFSYFQKELDKSKLSFGEPSKWPATTHWSDDWGGERIVKKRNGEFSSGLLINYRKIYFGAAAFRINQPNEGLSGSSRLPIRLAFNASYNWHISDKTLIHFFNRFESQAGLHYYQASATALLFSHLIVGGGFVVTNAPLATANLGYRHRYFTLQGSYGISPNAVDYQNTWEISASINLRNNDNRNLVTDFETW